MSGRPPELARMPSWAEPTPRGFRPVGDRVLARGEWWLGDPKPWQPAAVTVASDRLVFESARGMSDLTLANAIEDAGIERATAAIAALRYLPPGLG